MINKIKMELEGKRIEDYDNILFQKINEFNILKSNLETTINNVETTINNLKNNLKELNNKYNKDLNNLYNEKLNLMSNEVKHLIYINKCLCKELDHCRTSHAVCCTDLGRDLLQAITNIDYGDNYHFIYYFKCKKCNKIFQSKPYFGSDGYNHNAIDHRPPKKNRYSKKIYI